MLGISVGLTGNVATVARGIAATLATINDPLIRQLPVIGSLDQVTDSTPALRVEASTMLGKIRQRVVRLAHQQKLAIIESCYCIHPVSLSPERFSRSSA